MDEETRIKKGQILVQAIIEILGAPKEHVEETMLKVVDHMNEQEWLDVVSESVAEAEPQDKLFSTFADVQVWVKSFAHLIEFLFNYMPSSIEVIEPSELTLKREDVGNLLTEISGRLHQTDATVKELRARNQVIDKNTRTIIQNFITRVLETGAKSVEELAKATGIPKENVQAYLDVMAQKGLVKKQKNKYANT
ncbi:hypothetical protein D6774_01700 [Candidatus Woesearchaeota archaeon]|jgi:predicted transcriptional regulator|nr:MAG: hypothetical protein D6774_01700 [Candidatus Woesearchaeota archaeon]